MVTRRRDRPIHTQPSIWVYAISGIFCIAFSDQLHDHIQAWYTGNNSTDILNQLILMFLDKRRTKSFWNIILLFNCIYSHLYSKKPFVIQTVFHNGYGWTIRHIYMEFSQNTLIEDVFFKNEEKEGHHNLSLCLQAIIISFICFWRSTWQLDWATSKVCFEYFQSKMIEH